MIRLEKAPRGLRGDLTKWLLEIDSGVFVGRVNARVRENLWERVQKHVNNGRAIMVYSTNNEQGLAFKVHGSQWEPIDFDGMHLILRPSLARIKAKSSTGYKPGTSAAAQRLSAKRVRAKRMREEEGSSKREGDNCFPEAYVVIDVETTGFNNDKDEIIELGAIKVTSGGHIEEFSMLVKTQNPLPRKISELTGITERMLKEQGVDLEGALDSFLNFVGDLPCVAHNASFDYGFIRAACIKCGIKMFNNVQIDTLLMIRKLKLSFPNRKLSTIAEHWEIKAQSLHRSLEDCRVTMAVYEKLKSLERPQSG